MAGLVLMTLVGCDTAPTLPGTGTTTTTTATTETDTSVTTTEDTSVTTTEDTAVATTEDTAVATTEDTAVTTTEDTAVTTTEDTAVPPEDVVEEDPVPEPGGVITWNSPPSGYSTSHPAWAPTGPCSSGQWWTYSGTHESTNMHPGRDCVGCHQDHNGPSIRYAGTVYAAVDDTTECRGVSGVTVEILKADDTVAAKATTGSGGNFYFKSSQIAMLPEYRARLTYQGRTREMDGLQTEDDCNTCHDEVGQEDAPGRIVAP